MCHAEATATSTVPVLDLSPTAAWMNGMYCYDHAGWRRLHPLACLLLLMEIFHISCLAVDIMHCKYLGTDMYFLGSVLWILCFIILPGDAEHNLDTIWAEIVQLYKDTSTPCRFNNLTLSMFTLPGTPTEKFPKLKGKAAEIKDFVGILLQVWRRHMDTTVQWHRMIEVGLHMSSHIDHIITSTQQKFCLQGQELAEYQLAIFVFLCMQNALATYFCSNGIFLFNITIKSHYLAHGALQAAWLHPGRAWCFAGEDLMQHLKRVMEYSTHGIRVHQWSERLLEKYCEGMHLELTDVNAWYRA